MALAFTLHFVIQSGRELKYTSWFYRNVIRYDLHRKKFFETIWNFAEAVDPKVRNTTLPASVESNVLKCWSVSETKKDLSTVGSFYSLVCRFVTLKQCREPSWCRRDKSESDNDAMRVESQSMHYRQLTGVLIVFLSPICMVLRQYLVCTMLQPLHSMFESTQI